MQSPDTTPHASRLSIPQRERLLGQRGLVCWLTGLSGSGKSTIAYAAEQRLVEQGRTAFVLDGDNLRHGLCGDLGFSTEDRKENMRRVTEVARLFADASVITMVALVSPYAAVRNAARTAVGTDRFFEVHVATPLDVCESRDPKGLYKKARAGKITNMTGLDAPYEVPTAPDLRLSSNQSLTEQVDALLALLASSRPLLL